MAWVTTTFTHVNAGNAGFEEVAKFESAGESTNAIIHVNEPSGSGTKGFYIVGSIDGITYTVVDEINPIDFSDEGAIFTTETDKILPLKFVMPFYRILFWVSAGTKTTTFNLSEEIKGVELNSLNQG